MKEKREGVITEILPDGRVNADFGGEIKMCYLSGRMRLHHIKVIIGDKIEAEMDNYGGKGTNRITKRI